MQDSRLSSAAVYDVSRQGMCMQPLCASKISVPADKLCAHRQHQHNHSTTKWPCLWFAGANHEGPACEPTFREVLWQEEVFVRGRNRFDANSSGSLQPPVLQAGAIRAWDPSDKAQDLINTSGAVRRSTLTSALTATGSPAAAEATVPASVCSA
jgi:hypothetical protein